MAYWFREGLSLSAATPSRTSSSTGCEGGTARYVVVSDVALKLDLHVPMRFAVTRRHLVIQDVDGSEHKTAILQKLDNTPHGR